ncbi:protein translocase subunit SecD [Emcibacter sp. SYSU 3D8]|uniref:protein translocase subunit SecD n=1 Tax=Emcibacter sp. SYSU 3D8 TaxID=3133969 RepID=UPI0031FEF230
MQIPKWQIYLYSFIVLVGVILALPNVFTSAQLDRMPNWLPKKQVTLGLDLRGGSHLVLEVDSKALMKERLQSMADDIATKVRQDKISSVRAAPVGDSVLVTFRDPSRADQLRELIRDVTQAPATAMGPSQPDVDIESGGATQLRVTFTEAGTTRRITAAVDQSLEVVRKRIDGAGVAEPTIQRIGSDRILVQLPGVQDPGRITKLLGGTAKMTFHLVTTPVMAGETPPHGVFVLPDVETGEQLALIERPIVTGDHLENSDVSFSQYTSEPQVGFKFDSTGAQQFGRATREHAGERMAIVLDGKVLSAPRINEPILGGAGVITGNFTTTEAKDLSTMLKAGALPAPLTVIEERTVGADLGADSIKMGAWTGFIGFVLVFVLILLLYGTWGAIASVALLIHTILTLTVLTLLGATLTLPGIAGIVLGIGLAVDANVLINERIREESRRGLGAFAALEYGFKKAFSTIIDSNMTTLFAVILLFAVGTGPIRGFAITMGLGIVISLFTALTMVRVMMIWWIKVRKLKVLKMDPPFQIVPTGTNIRFMRARFLGIAVSAILSTASVVLFIVPGLNYGIDFKGGIQMEVEPAEGKADLGAMRDKLGSLGLGDISLQGADNNTRVLIRIEIQPGGDGAQRVAVEKARAAINEAAPGSQISRTEVVGPKISGELATTGIYAVLGASIIMLLYIWFRFEWYFAIGAIVTMMLDITKVVGFFAITQLDFNLSAVAALLTLVGYTVNDKVVVYDRMRENMRLFQKMDLRDIIDKSINETLTRSVYTSATTLLAMLPMAIWGGSAVESFAVPMIFGIVIAASSSIFIAAPILLFLGDWRIRRQAKEALNDDENANVGGVDPARMP